MATVIVKVTASPGSASCKSPNFVMVGSALLVIGLGGAAGLVTDGVEVIDGVRVTDGVIVTDGVTVVDAVSVIVEVNVGVDV